MNMFRQIGAVTAMNIRSLPQRVGTSLVTVIGVASVVAVMISLLSIGQGVVKMAGKTSSPDRAIILSGSASSEYMSNIPRSAVSIIAAAPGIKKDAAGKPMVHPQALIVVEAIKKSDGGSANIGFRGLAPEHLGANIKITDGRVYRPAVRELIVGRTARAQFKNLDVGDHVTLRGSEWTVVGAFEASGGLAENAIMGDTDTVLAAFDRSAYQSVGVQMESPAAIRELSDTLSTNPQLSVDVKREDKYIQSQMEQLTALLNFVGYFVGTVMAVGAVFGALNTMYSAVDARTREIATLRALGFGGTPVVISVMVEALLLSLPAALLGAGLAWLAFNGHAISTVGLTFPLAVTPKLVM
ncbi:MAG: ABC transporter permease, partial [Caulobacteraceae bacterium]